MEKKKGQTQREQTDKNKLSEGNDSRKKRENDKYERDVF